ncbi:MAG: hypothetical protein V7K89_07560 [Nostoc sp.]|uniref:hypothetical protein n=1 Tax=Nostoc sp. TaxID=1180 RepID=UPI002FF9EF26
MPATGCANGGNLRSKPVRLSRETLPVRLARLCALSYPAGSPSGDARTSLTLR